MDTYEENDIVPDSTEEEKLQNESTQIERIDQEQISAEETVDIEQTQFTEENVLVQEPSTEETAQQTESSDGFYHGAGTGVKESTLLMPDSNTNATAEDEFSQSSEASTPTPKRSRKKKGIGKKILKCSVVTLLILALIAAGCGISVAVTNRYWWSYYQTVQRNFDEQIQVLRQELDGHKNSGAGTIVPVQGIGPSQIYEQNIDSVVAVNCILRTTSNGKTYEAESSGSGFVLSSDGYIVTNHHVIDGAYSISVIFADGLKLTAKLIGSDAVNDIALLKVESRNLQPVTIGSSNSLLVGDQVIAIGNALGELSFSLTVGYVSGMDRNVSTDGAVMSMIQTDVSINSGNSGGPLFNARGEVVGITTAKYSGTTSSGASIEGISFAIPLDDVIGMLEDLREFGYIKSAYLGVGVRDIDPDVAETYGFPVGAYVSEVTTGFAADRAGVFAKDIITNLGGYKISNMSDLTRALRKLEPGQETTIVVWRSGQQITLNVVLDEKPHN